MTQRTKLWLALATLIVTASLFAPPGQAAGSQLVASVDEPFEINGEMFPAGELTVREVSAFSPVASLHEIQVDGASLGMVYAQQTDALRSRHDQLIFARADDGHLVLQAVALSGEPVRHLYRFQQSEDGNRWVPSAETEMMVANNK